MEKSNVVCKINVKVLGVVAAIALMVTTVIVNQSCLWFFGQEKMPRNSGKLRKF